MPTELLIQVTRNGDSYGGMAPGNARVYLTVIAELTLTDQRSGTGPMVVQTRIDWNKPALGFLRPSMTALGSGKKGQGVSFPIRRGSSCIIDPIESLTATGLRLTAARLLLFSGNFDEALWEYAAYDPPLVASTIAATAPIQLSPKPETMVRNWRAQKYKTDQISPDDERIPAALDQPRARPAPPTPTPGQQGLKVGPVVLPEKPIDPSDVILEHFRSVAD